MKSVWMLLVVAAVLVMGFVGMVAVMGYAWWAAGSADTSLAGSPLRSAVPSDATEVADNYVDMGPDYTYYLRARMSRGEFDGYCARVGLTRHTPERKYTDDAAVWLSWSADADAPKGWAPSDSLAETYVSQEGHSWTFAKYENGVLYVKSWSH
jgi:hypothetical protein